MVVALVFSSSTVSAEAVNPLQCAKAQCGAKSQTCFESYYDKFETCVKVGRKKCDSVPFPEKSKCIRGEISPCSVTRNKEQSACVTEVSSCIATCGLVVGKQLYYWCKVETGNTKVSAFCAVDVTSPNKTEQCAKGFTVEAGGEAKMTCEPLWGN